MTTNTASTAGQVVMNDIRDIKPPYEFPDPLAWLWWTLGLLAVLTAAFLVWRWLRQRQLKAAPVMIVPAHVRARQKLEEALALLDQPKPFCVAVSDTVRWYLEERFEFRAPERTTEEFLHELQSTNRLLPDQKESLGEFLRQCDLVKFARYEPGENELRGMHAAALRLVDETIPVQSPELSVQSSESK
ncbi:MAG: hypothetical protein U1F65_01935 [Verrucomicrobiota bacterium]